MAGDEKAIKLSQVHDYFGKTETIITRHALRINDQSMNFVLVAKAPKWDFCVYRTDDKISYSDSMLWLRRNGLVSDMFVPNRESILPGAYKPVDQKLCNTLVKRAIYKQQVLDYLPLPDVDKEIPVILHAFYKMSNNNGATLRFSKQGSHKNWFTSKDEHKNRETLMDTKAIDHISVPANYFDAPANYRKAKFIQAVMVSKERRDATTDLDDIFEMNRKR